MFPEANTREPHAVLRVCSQAWGIFTGGGDANWIGKCFSWVQEAFEGHHPDYEPLDTRYHDLEHTLQGTLCLAQLLRGWHRHGGSPALDERAFRLGIVAILFHDTGYLKPRGDRTGTGAKFTPVHVRRSAEFAGRILADRGFDADEIHAVQGMIRCTGVNANVRSIVFQRAVDRQVGRALATADLLGQMAAVDYVEKLPLLYEEFAEAVAHDPSSPGLPRFSGPDELIRQTPDFWDRHVRHRLDQDFDGVYRYLNDPWPDGPNVYLERIEANIARVRNARSGADA
ncbi:MAG: hypothetical protein JNL97_03135 [Verrucomicrobiales bacterium]|nr:hypothetical protein [Verrucomicrobiales bacterium]